MRSNQLVRLDLRPLVQLRGTIGRAAVVSMFVWLPAGYASEPATKPKPLQCETGPISKTYGATSWVVYSCADSRTVVVVAAPGSPAAPFYFMFAPTSEGYRLVGEGNGNREASNAAYEELKKLSKEDIQAIIDATTRR